jgi:hypothetical protein
LATASSGGMGAFIPYPIFHERRVPSALPAPEQTDKIYDLLPGGNWFYSFVIDHEIPFAHGRPLCANSGHSQTDKPSAEAWSVGEHRRASDSTFRLVCLPRFVCGGCISLAFNFVERSAPRIALVLLSLVGTMHLPSYMLTVKH